METKKDLYYSVKYYDGFKVLFFKPDNTRLRVIFEQRQNL